ncbi:MAG TPA: YdeI/OmpD-associated family protein [Blastocatellia bacterium]|nr:YdeI/OmpD-associated family protein [Blastocatellia bacterium]
MPKEVKSPRNTLTDLPVLPFERPKDWAVWLDKNHATSSGVWLKLAKKASGIKSVTYDEALEVALCYGWIDGQKRSHDETSWLQKFTPRGPRSIWSKINTEKAQALIESGRMKPAGQKAVESARQDGRWDAAYSSQSKAAVPDDLQVELDRNAKAKAFFATLDSRNRYAILHRIHMAKKAETRAKRIENFIRMLEKKEKIYP